VQVSEVVVVVVVVAVVIDSLKGSEARGSEQAVDHRVGRPVALGIGGWAEVWRRRVEARVTIQGGDGEGKGGADEEVRLSRRGV
jgi:hypothetical protein